MNRYKEWRIKRLNKKMETLREEFKWAFDNRKYLGELEYELFSSIIAGEIMDIERKINKINTREKRRKNEF